MFYNLDHTALTIISQCYGYNKVNIENCTFKNNYILSYEEFDAVLRPLIDIVSPQSSNSISFKQCNFKGNHHVNILIKILIKKSRQCYDHSGPATNITFMVCHFTDNIVSELMNIVNCYLCKTNLSIIGPSHFTKTQCGQYRNNCKQYYVISIYEMTVNIIGPVVISSNLANTIMRLENCDVTFYNNVTYKSNNGAQLIHIKFSWIKLMENANITLLKNRYQFRLIRIDYSEYDVNQQCLFQFVTSRNTTAVSPAKYSIHY